MITIKTTITGTPETVEVVRGRIAVQEENGHRANRNPPDPALPFGTIAELQSSLETIFDERIAIVWEGEMAQAGERNFQKFTPSEIQSIQETIADLGLTAAEVLTKLNA